MDVCCVVVSFLTQSLKVFASYLLHVANGAVCNVCSEVDFVFNQRGRRSIWSSGLKIKY